MISRLDIMTYPRISQFMSWYPCVNLYIQIYSISQYITVYDSIYWFMTVQVMYMQVYARLFNHLAVYDCLRNVYQPLTGIYLHITCSNDWFPAAPARLARLKAANSPLPLVWQKNTHVQAQWKWCFFFFASFGPPVPAWQGLPLRWLQWALPARHCTRRILRPAAIPAMLHWCSSS